MFSSVLDDDAPWPHVLNVFETSDSQRDRAARTSGRLVFGVVLLAGAAILTTRLLDRPDPQVAKLLGATWTLAAVAGWVVQQLVGGLARRADGERLFVASWAVAAAGVALLLPLTLHLPVSLALGGSLAAFDGWAELSLRITATAHVAFALLAVARATRLAQGRTAISTRAIFMWTLVVSAIPYAVLFFLPPLLVGFTGLAIVPLLDRMPRWIARDRGATLPTAIVV